MTGQLSAVNDRLGRAEEHLESIKRELLGYYNSDPCQMSGEFYPDPDGRGSLDWTIQTAPITVRLNTILGEFLHDLRSALDHLAWQLVLQHQGHPSEETCFPILKIRPTPDKKGQAPPRVAGDVPSEALAGARLRLVPDDPSVDVDAYLTLEVSIHEPDHGIEAPLLGTLEQILERVTRIVTTAENRCF